MCNENFGLCPKHAITEIETKTVVNNILSDKPASIQDDNFINNMYA